MDIKFFLLILIYIYFNPMKKIIKYNIYDLKFSLINNLY
jgi:hypothetical protein